MRIRHALVCLSSDRTIYALSVVMRMCSQTRYAGREVRSDDCGRAGWLVVRPGHKAQGKDKQASAQIFRRVLHFSSLPRDPAAALLRPHLFKETLNEERYKVTNDKLFSCSIIVAGGIWSSVPALEKRRWLAWFRAWIHLCSNGNFQKHHLYIRDATLPWYSCQSSTHHVL